MKFDPGALFHNTFAELGMHPYLVLNTYNPPHDPESGWPMKLPDVDLDDHTLLILTLQDWLTYKDGVWLELQRIEQMYQNRCDRVAVIHWPHGFQRHYQGPVNLLEFNVHEAAIISHLKALTSSWQPQLDQAKNLAWQCLNGRRCAHRLRAAQYLEKELNGILSYGDVVPLPDWPYSTYPGTENEDNFLRLLPVYSRAAVNIVTETIYDDPTGIISEKTVFSMLSKQIPIVIGYQGIVRDCRSMGFDMFDDLVDTSYDDLPNDRRVEAAMRSNLDLIKGHIDLAPYYDRLHAQQQFVLTEYTTSMTSRFRHQCQVLADKILSQ